MPRTLLVVSVGVLVSVGLLAGCKTKYADLPQDTDIIRELDATATGCPVSGRVKGNNLVSLLHQCGYIGSEIPAGGFKAMGNKYPFTGRLQVGQPAMTADGMAGITKREGFPAFEGGRPFFGDPLLRGAEKFERFYRRFARSGHGKDVYPGACISKC